MSKTATPPNPRHEPIKERPAPTPFKAADQVRVLKAGTMDPVKAIRKMRGR